MNQQLLESITDEMPDLVGGLLENMQKELNATIERECINFLKLHRLYEDGDTAVQAIERLKAKGMTVDMEHERDISAITCGKYTYRNKVKFKLLKLIDSRGVVIKNTISTI